MARNNSFIENGGRHKENSGLLERQTELKEFQFFKSKSILESRVAKKTEWLKIHKN